ncbi:hypothetical protein GYMLUDRAFT_464195 [Collybiopsis luxurians FD-317 M1]|uniref:P-loop containing nucleoside triphosphate hydrolase protein n=1 Tax=Collybiopsis luxurians FD-317 M1 TaxID=944289 RepID=A0A0D0D267_9AGAR|nr:hypothetical protein GYMLUDRAFT_464195 [Collybiopsis luxurians FD-317 M1]
MSTSRRPCKFINTPEGCRRGSRCPFSHDRASAAGNSGIWGNIPGRVPTSPASPNSRAGEAPRDVCNFFWKTGQCSRGFNCIFRHVQKPNGGSNPQSNTLSTIHKPTVDEDNKKKALRWRLRQRYDPPGYLRTGGPRHDNDSVEISSIRIVPTHEEMLCPVPPYLPVNLPEAPHHCRPGSMERLLDVQFRLLREELVAPIRKSISIIQDDLSTIAAHRGENKGPLTQLEEILARNGGLYRTKGPHYVMFQVYTNIELAPLRAERGGLTVGLILDAPPGGAQAADADARQEYWKYAGSKRLSSGSLVALLLIKNYRVTVFLGCIASSNSKLVDSSRFHSSQVEIQIIFMDPKMELMALRHEKVTVNQSHFAILVDHGILFESIRPFLDTLQSKEPGSIQFKQYLCQSGKFNKWQLPPPKIANSSTFEFNLDCLARPGEYIHPLKAHDENSIRRARLELKLSSSLDSSQADAMVDALTREIALIQGPPGTGKSFTSREILRVLLQNRIKPVMLIAFTNNALDNMLLLLLEKNITSNFVRVGSRTTNDRIAEYSLDKLEKTLPERSTSNRTVDRKYAAMKHLEEKMNKLLVEMHIPEITLTGIFKYLESYPSQLETLQHPPYWINNLYEEMIGNSNDSIEWRTMVSRKKQLADDKQIVTTIYGFWKFSQDLEFIRPPSIPEIGEVAHVPKRGRTKMTQAGKPAAQIQDILSEHTTRMNKFFGALGYGNQVPSIPEGQRPVDELLIIENVWSLSPQERLTLALYWEDQMRRNAYQSHLHEYEFIRGEYKDAWKDYNDARDENRRELLASVDLIGCTTNGAAKLTSLLTTVGPKALVVEEAGQVLEAHILASLVPSVQHLICIGDPQQLRPIITNYNLSMDSDRGKELFKFDRSLMERLSDMGLPMSQLNVQRRMRPSISAHIRNILYPKLEDQLHVTKYPPVQGMQQDVFFLNHSNREDDGEEELSVSKTNSFEVEMIVDLVVYLLKQERYSAPGDIAVLCAYLGQLQKVRIALKNLKVGVLLDERDEEELVRQGMEDEGAIEEVEVARRIQLGSVDAFQGLEAKIVIVSLVRNSGLSEGSGAAIGFLKSSNRINVALSRAQHGLYVLGNASNLRANNETWRTIIDKMEQEGQIGGGLPIICPRHPDEKRIICKPGDLTREAPEGGCLRDCNYRMDCGHYCPSTCHLDRDNHRSMKCMMPCLRTPCPRSHPCPKSCSDDCGLCSFPMNEVTLPCGHITSILCYEYDDLESVYCTEKIEKPLPGCKHSAIMACFMPPEKFRCTKVCSGITTCCGRTCKSSCADCQESNLSESKVIGRRSHKEHPCDRTLYCQHLCGQACSQDHECTKFCKQQCRQRCTHHECPKSCGDACAPCAEPCEWICPHLSCPVTCGAICARLPCDVPCRETLKCGHRCNSVCGENCAQQKCVACLPDDAKQDIVDFLMQRPLADIDLDSDDISERLITLECGHIFTVETLDRHCHMSDFYEIDELGRYLAMKAPPTEFQQPPTCPTCRSPITVRRYGRVIKRANLDILEQNVASNLAKTLDDMGPTIGILKSRIPNLETSLKDLKYDASEETGALPHVEEIQAKREELMGSENAILPPDMLSKNAMSKYHGIPLEDAELWFGLISTFHSVYIKVARVVSSRSAHVRAYEAALSTLYRLELAELASNPPPGMTTAQNLAFQNVHVKIGQPPHKADRRYQLEAFLISVELRFMLGSLARSRADNLPLTSNVGEIRNLRRLWASFADFIYFSCEIDCRKAIAIADRSSSSRLAARSTTLLMCSDFERFRYGIMQRRSEKAVLVGQTSNWREELREEIRTRRSAMRTLLQKAEGVYMRNRPVKTDQQLGDEHAWFQHNCQARVNRCLEEFTELENHVMNDTVYQAVPIQEKEEIVKAFGFSHRGHFYNCPNGHPFVITECGGAMEASS